MSRIRIVKGKITINTKGNHYMYSEGNITFNAKGFINETANNHTYGDPIDPPAPPVNTNIVDIIMFVAGTTDPINIKGEKHQANKSYWRDSQINFWAKVKELKLQYLNLHIEDEFFSWSGDNNTEERNIAADRLLDLFTRVYPKFKNQETHLHLIGHSHGGNVINQFTELVATDKRFPKSWKIKSITYLSTPFFHKKHQLNHTKLHDKCQIINVHNEYDLTQQLIADFSLVNLEGLLKSFQMDKFNDGIKTIKSVDSDAIKKNGFVIYMNDVEGAIVWKEMSKAFLGINMIIAQFIKYINSLKIENSNLQKEKNEFLNLLNNLLQWTYDVHNNYTGTKEKYSKKIFVENLKLTQGLKVLNILFYIRTGSKDSYILRLLAGIFGESKGITDSIDETSWTPIKQTKGLSILDLKICESDPYHSRNKKNQFDAFLRGTQNVVYSNNLEDLLMRLFSQFIKPTEIKKIVDIIDSLEYVVYGNLSLQIKILHNNFNKYYSLITKYHAGLVAEKDERQISDIMKRPGTISYLAMVSHSLSHTKFWLEVEDGLRNAISSGKNPGYKKQ